VPAVVALYVWRERRRLQDASVWASPALVPNLIDRSPGLRRHLPLAILVVALAAMVVGVAKPRATISVRREEATILLAIDTSRSMGATDVKPSRLAAAQLAATQFVDRAPKKFRVGVISFSTHAVVAAAPTTDRDYVRAAIAALHTGEGTALGDAVMLAAILGQRQKTSDGVIPPTSVLLISDGSRDGGRFSAEAATARAKALHVPVYTVALGTANGTVEHALPGGLREILKVPPSPATMQKIASGTGGEYFAAPSADKLSAVYKQLGSRLGHKKESRQMTDVFAGGAALLLLVGGGLSALWFRRVP
jgi:Ca-activated chloride channel homolog